MAFGASNTYQSGPYGMGMTGVSPQFMGMYGHLPYQQAQPTGPAGSRSYSSLSEYMRANPGSGPGASQQTSQTFGQAAGMGGTDPYSQAATGFLQSVISGQQLPYDANTQNNMLSQASDMTGAAERQQLGAANRSAMAGGASRADMGGLQREMAARRQSGNMQAAQGIGAQANQANFDARMQASRHMASFGLQQQEMARRAAAAYGAGQQQPTGGRSIGAYGMSAGSSGNYGGIGSPYTGFKG